MTIYLGNLDPAATEETVRRLFARFGEVRQVTLVREGENGRLRGFGFVEMAGDQALRAIAALDGAEFLGSTLRVNEARDRGATPPRRPW